MLHVHKTRPNSMHLSRKHFFLSNKGKMGSWFTTVVEILSFKVEKKKIRKNPVFSNPYCPERVNLEVIFFEITHKSIFFIEFDQFS